MIVETGHHRDGVQVQVSPDVRVVYAGAQQQGGGFNAAPCHHDARGSNHDLVAAARDGVSVSAWMTAAARDALRRRAGLAAVALWEKQHGRFTTEEMNEARGSVRPI